MGSPTNPASGPVRSRLPGAAAAILTVAVGLAVHTYGDGWLAGYVGDALYTVMVYALVVLVRPSIWPAVAACWALGTSWAVEVLQLTDIPAQLSAAVPLMRLVVGTTYNALDLVAYVVGAAAAYLVHRLFATRIQ
jgi:hypothetical protein